MTDGWSLEVWKIKDLLSHEKNPRKLSDLDEKQLKLSIERFGLIDKPIISKSGGVIGGHQRIKVLKKMGVKSVECWVSNKDLTQQEIDELCIKLNRVQGEWDWEILSKDWNLDDLLQWGFTAEECALEGSFAAIEHHKEPSAETEKKKTKCPSCGHEF